MVDFYLDLRTRRISADLIDALKMMSKISRRIIPLGRIKRIVFIVEILPVAFISFILLLVRPIRMRMGP